MDSSAAGKALQAQRKQVTRGCLECGWPITGTVRRKFCNQTHRVRYQRRQRRAAIAAPSGGVEGKP